MEPVIDPDEALAAAKANLVQVAREFDPLAILRRHPYLTVTVAGATGAFAGANTDKIAEWTRLGRSMTVALRSATRLFRPVAFTLLRGWQEGRKKHAQAASNECDPEAAQTAESS
jgi:hypothetical protein